ncbi:phospholipid-transporting ATPase ABCA3-like isoform X2 [Ornithodoros turicata]|uniref:phospholipid-transporting ATPase ABCA3-like isoform X2 n=1 Tax=Ornithodoros turicata TaxID=34597 RepID=UPI00313A48B0
MGHLTQLAIILWKNLYVQKLKRHYLLTAAEVLMAALCFVGIEGDRPIIPRPNGTEPPYLAPFLVYNATTAADVHKPKVLLYSPNGVATVKTLVESAFQGYPSVQLMGYPNEDALMNAFRKEAPIPERGPDQTVITLQVEVSLAPANLQYIVGFYDNGDFVSRRYKNYPIFDPLPDAVTQRETVTLCQMALGSAYLNMVRTSRKYANASLYDVVSHRIPQGPHPWDTESRRYILAIRLGAAFLLPFCVFVGKMVRETETGIKERLCMIGMHDCAYWTAQFITSMVVGTVASALVVAYMSCYPLTGHGVSQTFLDDTSKTVVSFCFLLFCVQYTAVAMAMSLFYTNHVAAVAFASFFWMTASFVPCMVLEDWSGWSAYYLTLHRYTKLLSSLLPCMAVHWCFRIIGCANLVGEQYGWNCIGHYVLDLDNITMAEIWVCMTAGTIVSLVMVWYLSNVLPWARGVPRPFWFFLSSRYWLPAHMGTYVEAESQRPDDVYFEEGPSDTKPAVILDGLGLEKQQSYILHDMNFKAYFGEITVVLGPKGAGKTQLVSLIAGLVKPTRGRVIVNGFDMASETRSARRELGLCVNPDILFDDLTGYETLVLFGIMKDISRDILYVRITEVQDALGISPVMSTRLTSEMSRSQRRLLTIAGAILVGSGIIVLDEPAAGLDAYGRTTLWSTLTKMKHSGPTCIIIATADALETENICDRIAILGYGALKCHGSRAFVRRRFGCGLNVRLEKMHTGFATGAIIDIVQMHVPDVVVVSNSKEAMVLGMGEQKDLRVMAVAVQMLERDRGSLGIFSVTVFSDTMEDIMIRLVIDLVPKPVRVRGRESSFRHQSIVSRPSQTTLADYTGGSTTPVNVPAMHIEGLTALQGPCEPEVDVRVHVKELWNLKPAHPTTTQVFWALLAKRVFYTRQTWGLPLFCWFVPTAVVFFMCHLETTLHLRRNPMTLTSLSPDTLVYSLRDMYPSSNVFMAHDKLAEPLAHPLYQTLVVENAGLIASIDKLDAFLLHLAERRTLGIAEEDFLLGAHFTAGGRSKRHAVAYYNGDTYHTQAISLNLINTALLRSVSSEPTAKITAVLRPIRTSPRMHTSKRVGNVERARILSRIGTDRVVRFLLLPIATGAVLASFVLFPIDERVTRARTIQTFSGVTPAAYWISNYTWDLIAALISILCMLLPVFFCHPHVVRLVVYIVCFTLAYVHCTVPLVYMFSFVTDSMLVGFFTLMAALSFTGMSSTMWYSLFLAESEKGQDLFQPAERSDVLYLLYPLPPFTYHWSIVKVIQLSLENWICTENTAQDLHDICAYIQNSKEGAAALLTGLRFCCAEFYKNNMTHLSTLGYLSFHRDSAGTELLVMIIEGALFMLLLVTYEGGVYRPLVGFRSEGTPSGQPPQDVADERRIVEKATAQRDFSNAALYVHNLQKRIGQRTKVRGVSFHVKPGECLVIFGLRHSGKSTLINLLSGVQEATAGTANMPDVALTDLEDWHQRIGVCPDYDGNLGSLTVHQTLWVYAKIRGIESGRVEELVSHVVNLLNLRNYDTWYVKDCDASVRRRLAVGVAVVGLPPVVLMDDPAFGLDAVSRQNIYDTIRLIRELATSAVVIATSSMSDCKLMSDRMALMVDGQFQSIGTEKDVLKRLCQGCQLRLRFLPFQAENAVFMVYVNRRVRHWFPEEVVSLCMSPDQ